MDWDPVFPSIFGTYLDPQSMYVKLWPFRQFSKRFGHYFTYCWGPGGTIFSPARAVASVETPMYIVPFWVCCSFHAGDCSTILPKIKNGTTLESGNL